MGEERDLQPAGKASSRGVKRGFMGPKERPVEASSNEHKRLRPALGAWSTALQQASVVFAAVAAEVLKQQGKWSVPRKRHSGTKKFSCIL